MDKILNALFNKQRIKIITCLGKKPKNVTEIIKTCGISQSAVSQHLSKLRDANLVITTKEGKNVIYSLNNKHTLSIAKQVYKLHKELNK